MRKFNGILLKPKCSHSHIFLLNYANVALVLSTISDVYAKLGK